MELKITIQVDADTCRQLVMAIQSLKAYPGGTDEPVLGTTEAPAEPIVVEAEPKPKETPKTVDY